MAVIYELYTRLHVGSMFSSDSIHA